MTLFQKLIAVTVTAASLTLISNAMAHEEKSPEAMAIEYRQSAFTMIRYNFGPMAAMIKGEKEFNAADFAKYAEAVATLSKFPGAGFIPGSDKGGKTEAKEGIWSNRADFDKKMETFQVEAASLAEAAKGATSVDAIKPQFGKVAESCKACHKEYRQD